MRAGRSALALLLSAFLFGPALTRAEPVDVLLVLPSDSALAPVRAQLGQRIHEGRAAWELWVGTVAGHTVALTRSEGDPLNAVAATTIAVRAHPPKLIVVAGTAEPLDPALHPGDIVVSSAFTAFDGMVSPVTAADGGSHPLAWSILPHLAMTAGERETAMPNFPADPAASALALRVLGARPPSGGAGPLARNPLSGDETPSSRSTAGLRVALGVLGSANQVNREADRLAWIRSQWGASTADTDSAFVAGAANLLAVPVVGFRVIGGSDADIAPLLLKFLAALP